MTKNLLKSEWWVAGVCSFVSVGLVCWSAHFECLRTTHGVFMFEAACTSSMLTFATVWCLEQLNSWSLEWEGIRDVRSSHHWSHVFQRVTTSVRRWLEIEWHRQGMLCRRRMTAQLTLGHLIHLSLSPNTKQQFWTKGGSSKLLR